MDIYNKTLTIQIQYCLIILLVTLLLFPLLQILIPQLYDKNNKTIKGKIFWIQKTINTKINNQFANIYLDMQITLLKILLENSIFSCLILMPIYINSNKCNQGVWICQQIFNVSSQSTIQIVILLYQLIFIIEFERNMIQFEKQYIRQKIYLMKSQKYYSIVLVCPKQFENQCLNLYQNVLKLTYVSPQIKKQIKLIQKLSKTNKPFAIQKLSRKLEQTGKNQNISIIIIQQQKGFIPLIYDENIEIYSYKIGCPKDTIYDYFYHKNIEKYIKQIIFVLVMILLIVIYFFPNQLIYSKMISLQSELLYDLQEKCNTKFCNILYNTIFVLLPMSVQGSIIGSIPFCVYYSTKLLLPKQYSVKRRISYIILVLFYCLFWGLLNLVLKSTDYDTFLQSIEYVKTLSFKDFLLYVTTNLQTQVIVIAQFFVVKYILFPVFQLIKLPQLLFYILQRTICIKKEQIKIPDYDYHMKLAYYTHMFIISTSFTPIFPLFSLLGLLCSIAMSLCDKYNILYSSTTKDIFVPKQDIFYDCIVLSRLSILMMLIVYIAYIGWFGNKYDIFISVCTILVFIIYLIYLIYRKRYIKRAINQQFLSNIQESSYITQSQLKYEDQYNLEFQ